MSRGKLKNAHKPTLSDRNLVDRHSIISFLPHFPFCLLKSIWNAIVNSNFALKPFLHSSEQPTRSSISSPILFFSLLSALQFYLKCQQDKLTILIFITFLRTQPFSVLRDLLLTGTKGWEHLEAAAEAQANIDATLLDA